MATHGQALKAFKVVLEIGQAKTDAPVSLALFRLKKRLRDAVDFVSEEEQKIVESCDGTIDPDTGIVKIDDPEKRIEFAQKQMEVYTMPYDFGEKVKLPIAGLPKMTEADIEILDLFVDFD